MASSRSLAESEGEEVALEFENDAFNESHDVVQSMRAKQFKTALSFQFSPVLSMRPNFLSRGNSIFSGEDGAAGLFDQKVIAKKQSSNENIDLLRLEQRIFLKAAFQLLEEREFLQETNVFRASMINSSTCPIISGVLRKYHSRSLGGIQAIRWKPKVARLGSGTLEYFEEPHHSNQPETKVIFLYKECCTCRVIHELPSHNLEENGLTNHINTQLYLSGIGQQELDKGSVFEITVSGKKTTYWATDSRQDCSKWVSSINSAMVNRPINPEEIVSRVVPKISKLSAHRDDMIQFLRLRETLRIAHNIEEYLTGLEAIDKWESRKICIPVRWVKQQLPGLERAFSMSIMLQNTVTRKSQLAQLWKDTQRDSIKINGHLLKGEQGMEAMVGALVRYILANTTPALHQMQENLNDSESMILTEAESLLSARDVLLACNRTTSAGDTYQVVDHLCRNYSLVLITPADREAEPLNITVRLVEPQQSKEKLYEGDINKDIVNDLPYRSPTSLKEQFMFQERTTEEPSSSYSMHEECLSPKKRPSYEHDSIIDSPSHSHRDGDHDNTVFLEELRHPFQLFHRGRSKSPKLRKNLTEFDGKSKNLMAKAGRKFHSLECTPTQPIPAFSTRHVGRTISLSRSPMNIKNFFHHLGSKNASPKTEQFIEEESHVTEEVPKISDNRSVGPYIEIKCIATTTYKLVPADPQDDLDCFTVITGSLEQIFKISRSASEGVYKRPTTDGSYCHISFSQVSQGQITSTSEREFVASPPHRSSSRLDSNSVASINSQLSILSHP